jgi:hypothetical protein
MEPVNLAFEVPAGAGRGIVWVVRGIVWVVRELYEHPVIGIPVGILLSFALICGLIVVVVRIVSK